MLLWTLHPAERDALLANEAIRKLKHFVVLEIACSRTPRDLFLVKEEYHARFKRSIEEDVAQYTTGDFRRVRQCFKILDLKTSRSFRLDFFYKCLLQLSVVY